MAGLVLALFLIAVMTIPLALPYFAVQHDLGLERGIQDAEYYAATLRTYLSVPDGNWLYHAWLAPRARLTGSGERDFVGFTAIVLGLIGLFAARAPRADFKLYYLLLAIAGVILSFGARNEILLFPRWPIIHLPFYLPYRYLFFWVPGFKAMRGPDRFAYLAVLGLAVLAGYGTRALIARIQAIRPNVRYAVPASALALVSLIAVENIAVPIRATNPATLAKPVPGYAQYLARGDPNSAVLEIPMLLDNESLTWPQYYSIYHWRKLVNGFSGFFPPSYDALVKLSDEFPSEASLAVLSEIGVRDIVVHNDLLKAEDQKAFLQRLAAFTGRVQPVYHSGNVADPRTGDDIYELTDGGQDWAAALAQQIPNGARVWLKNARPDKRLVFEFAAAFLPNRQLYGDPQAALRNLPAPGANSTIDYVLVNAGDPVPASFTRRVWGNDVIVVYARESK
ncbi:MAG: hypothetical protein WCF84_04920 [Anaerolineae bacterium]